MGAISFMVLRGQKEKEEKKKKNSNNFLWLLSESPTQKEDTVFDGREHPET